MTTVSTSIVLPNVIAKLALKSTCHISHDGVKTFQYEGIIKSLDAHLVYLAAARESYNDSSVTFINKGEGYDWTVVQARVARKPSASLTAG